MARAGDYYIVDLKQAHLEWGSHRYTDSRGIVYGEGYIQIPADIAYRLKLYNNNGTRHTDILGENLFNCTSADGLFEGVLRAQGNQPNKNYAKQFSGDKNLKSVGSWYQSIAANIGDRIKVTWTSPTDIIIERI